MIRAVVFDLDDTLYPERDYAFSGFAAVSRAFADVLGDSDTAAADMRRLFDTANRGRLFSALLSERGRRDEPELVQRMVETFRSHRPEIQLYPDAEAALTHLRPRYRLGLITDGPAVQQWAKIDALGLRSRLDQIIVTGELGNEEWRIGNGEWERHEGTKAQRHEGTESGSDEATERRSDEGECKGREPDEANIRHSGVAVRHSFAKPHPYAFELMSHRLGIAENECVYVADNPAKDFIGPNRLGWVTVCVKRAGGIYEHAATPAGGEPNHTIATLDGLEKCLSPRLP